MYVIHGSMYSFLDIKLLHIITLFILVKYIFFLTNQASLISLLFSVISGTKCIYFVYYMTKNVFIFDKILCFMHEKIMKYNYVIYLHIVVLDLIYDITSVIYLSVE